MNNWDDLRFLLAVHKSGTMSAAASVMGTNVATVSRRIEKLTEQLGFPPFLKSSSGWSAHPKVLSLLEMLDMFDSELSSELNSVSVLSPSERLPVRIGAPPVLCSQILFPSLQNAAAMLENVQLEFFERYGGEGLGDYDIVIQTTRPETGRIVHRRVGTMNLRAYGYAPLTGDDEWVGIARDFDNLLGNQMGLRLFGREPIIRTANFDQAIAVIQATRLPGILPAPLAQCDPMLQPVGDPDQSYAVELWMLYHQTRRIDPIIKLVSDWIIDATRQLRQN